jgi:hypothetical protein
MAQDRHATIIELQNTLTKEASGYRKLVELTRREQEALRTNNLVDLAVMVQDKEELLPQLQQWEANREQLVAQLAGEFQLPVAATLTDLIERLDGAIAQKLAALREEFVNLVEQLIRLSHANQMILQAGLVRVDATFQYLASLTATKPAHYSANGAGPSSPQTGNVLNWEA